MKILEKKLNLLYKLIYKLGRAINNWGTLIILIISLIFFYPVLLQNKIPLPLDALVGAHVPWTEVNWDGYPDDSTEFKSYQSFKVHNLSVLLHLSGLEKRIQNEKKQTANSIVPQKANVTHRLS